MTMRLVASVYVDNQDRAAYPVRWVTRNLDMAEAVYLFGSDERNCALLRDIRESHPMAARMKLPPPVDVKIASPGDIARAQNACVDWLRANDAFDYCLLLQADTTVTARGLRFIEKFLSEGDDRRPVVMLVLQNIKMHVETHRTHFGVALIGRRSDNAEFVGDGAYTSGYWRSTDDSDRVWHALEIGALSVDAYGRKVSNHRNIWPDPMMARLAELYRGDRRSFILEALRHIRQRDLGGRSPRLAGLDDPDYFEYVQHHGLAEERTQVAGLLGSA